MPLVRVQKNGQVTLPTALRARVGLADGDLLEVKLERGEIILTPRLVVNRTARDEYTPAQRRVIDRELAKGLEDIKRGRFHGPFNTADEAIASIKATLKQRAAVRKTKRSR